MLLSSARSPCFPGYQLLPELTDKMDDEQLEILSFLTSSDTSSRESSPYSVLTSSATSYLSDDMELPDGMIFHHRTALMDPPAQTVIDPRLLSAPYSTAIKEPVKCELPRRRPEARKASLTTLDDPDFEVEDSSGLDDDEYFPFEETKRKKRVSPLKRCVTPTKKRRTTSPSPNVTVPNPKNRARNLPSSTDEVERELKRISNVIKGTAKKKTPGRRNKDLACQLCYKQCNRQSDLLRHVATHYPLRDSKPIVCRGISKEEALEHNIDPGHLRTCHEQDRVRIGGCGMSFSRRDALLRHVKLRTSQCIFLKPETGQLIGSC